MERATLKGGRLKAAAFDERERRLELTFVDGDVKVYKGVQVEVWRRLIAAPNPASFFEDRIAEEYPLERGSAAASPDARAQIDSLFGPPRSDS